MNNEFEQSIFFDFLEVEQDNLNQKEKLRLKEGERREVTILFADVKNSTALGSQLDPEIFARKLDELMKRFTKCITYYGGYVDKYLGDGIMALFGAKKATEQDTERAVLAALRMINQTELYNQKLMAMNSPPEEQIGIRIGINSGLVLVGKVGEQREGDFTVTGAAVHLAQRMEANAPVGRILLPLHTKQAVERFFEFEHLGLVQAKGFSTPVDSYTVLRPRLEKGQRWYRKKSVYIGREQELNQLNQAFTHLERRLKGIDDGSQASCIIGIKGDAGLGKTRLVYEFCSAHENRMTLLSAAASGIVKTPFNLFINLLEHEFRLSLGEPLPLKQQKLEQGFQRLSQKLGDKDAAELKDALPLIGALLEIPYPDQRLRQSGTELLTHLKLALQIVLTRILQQHAHQDRPILLVLDDLHWLDESSASVFGFLLKSLLGNADSPLRDKILLILEYRQDYLPPAEALSHPGFMELELEPLNDREMESMIRQHIGELTVSEETIGKVKLLSLGNPFYLEEWCNYLGELPKHDLHDLPVPANLHALILSRLDLLEGSIRQLLQKASVIGHEFFVDILSWIEDKLYDPIDIAGTLSQLEQQAFILKLLGFDYSAYFFKHIITRDVAYQTLLLENRAILHQLAAEAIEELYPDHRQEFHFLLADHYHRAGVADKAIFYLEQAALAAKKVYSNKLAIELFEKLLEWVEKSVTDSVTLASAGRSPGFSRVDHTESSSLTSTRILLHLSEIKWLIGSWDESDADLQLAFVHANQTEDPVDLFDCHRLKGISSFQRGKPEQAKTEWDTCLTIAEGIATHGTTDVPFSKIDHGTTDVPVGKIAAEDTGAPYQDATPYLAIVHGNLGIWHQHHKHYAEAIDHHQLSLRYAVEVNDELRQARSLTNLGLIYLNLKDYGKAEERFTQCLNLAEANLYLKEQSIALGNLGYLHYKQEKLDKAIHYYQKKWLLVDKMDDKAELIKVLGNIANIHSDRGEHREALEYYRKVLALKLPLGNPKELAITHNSIAGELAELNRFQEAIVEYDQAIDNSYAVDPTLCCECLYFKADTLYKLNDFEQALQVNQQALKMATEHNRPAVVAACNSFDEQIRKHSTS